MNFNEEKLQREILVSKLLRDDSIKTENGLEKDKIEKFLTAIYLLFSIESRKIIGNDINDCKNEINFHSLIGFDKNNFDNKNRKITKKEILGLCNRFINLEIDRKF